jgi:hypothetical protein
LDVHVPAAALLQNHQKPAVPGLRHVPMYISIAPSFSDAPFLAVYWLAKRISVIVALGGVVAGFK